MGSPVEHIWSISPLKKKGRYAPFLFVCSICDLTINTATHRFVYEVHNEYRAFKTHVRRSL